MRLLGENRTDTHRSCHVTRVLRPHNAPCWLCSGNGWCHKSGATIYTRAPRSDTAAVRTAIAPQTKPVVHHL